jgi:hypothetical protein
MRCREAAAVLLRAEDMPLRWRERVRLKLHLAACDACTQFQGQLTLMRGAMGQWRRYRDGIGAEGEDVRP